MVSARITFEVCQVNDSSCRTSRPSGNRVGVGFERMSCNASVGDVSRRDLSIRPAVDSDLDQCARLRANDVSGDLEMWRERFTSDLHNAKRRFIVAEIGASVVGYGHTVRHERSPDAETDSSPSGFFLAGLLVAPEFRRDGIGSRLTSARLEALRAETKTVFYLADPENQATISLHRRFGFEEVRRVVRDDSSYLLFQLDMDY
jgi:ribosomal protein S18 acetylase RimI-like enzyme